MSATVATFAGALAVAIVFLLAGAARRPRSRAVVDEPKDATRKHASRRRLVAIAAGPAALTAALLGPMAVLAVGGVAVAVVAQRRRAATSRRLRQRDAAMIDAVELFVLCVHAGRSPTQAIGDVASRAPPALHQVFAAVELQLHRGRSLADALDELRQSGGPVGRELAAAVASADRDGVPLAPVLDRLAAEARAARRRAGEAAARQLPVRMSFPLVVCTLPSFVLLAIAPAVLGALSTLRATAP